MTSSDLYSAHCTRNHGEGNWDFSSYQMFRNHFSLKCRSGFFSSAEKEKNLWIVEESEYFEKADEFLPYIRVKREELESSSGSTRKSESNSDDIAKIIGGALGIVIAAIVIIGFLKIVSGAVSSSSYGGSSYSPQSSGSTMTIDGKTYTKQQLEDELRREAEALYDNCQTFGRSYSDKCP